MSIHTTRKLDIQQRPKPLLKRSKSIAIDFGGYTNAPKALGDTRWYRPAPTLLEALV